MTSSRLTILAAALAISAASPGEAAAQGFFERLFGIRPAPVPPASIPQQQQRPLPPPPPGVPGVPPADWTPPGGGPAGPSQSAGPAPARPVAVKSPSEDSIIGRDLKLNGSAGALRVERGQGGLRAQITLAGTKVSQPTESCSVKLGGGDAVTLSSLGKPDGLARYEAQTPACPIIFDVLEGGALVTAPAEACVIQEADCRAEPRGLWGPDPAGLIPKVAELDQARGSFDKAVRENYKALTQRAGPQAARPIVAEQAAFSSDREQVCRSYAREGAHGFCNARFTEARAATLASRLGILMQSAQPATPGQPEAQAERPRRSRPPPLSSADAPVGQDPSYVR
jgi:hypothetical protein